jgi:lipopolysaccharide transport system ATP-binding protein
VFAIRFENVSKSYRIGRQRSITAAFDVVLDRVRGRKSGRPIHWALDDVSFEVEEGDSLGLLGPNGAGKTTILKLLSRVTWPTRGRVLVAGKVISLIELGAGFHAELTGRENIYLHGAILGLSRSHIARVMDEIIDFAGIERYADTPVKWYSSGMYARLGFSVAAFSDPDVLLIDEVLAVGDTAFQRRAIDKMREFVRAGKTVVLVSHDLGNVRGLCRQVLWLDKGKIRAVGPTEQVVGQYLDDVNRRSAEEQVARDRTETRGGSGDARFGEVELLDAGGARRDLFRPGESLRIRATYRAFKPLERPVFRFAIRAPSHGVTVCAIDSAEAIPATVSDDGVVECEIESLPLRPGHYSMALSILGPDRIALYDHLGIAHDFVVSHGGLEEAAGGGVDDLIAVAGRVRHLAPAAMIESR